MSTSFGFKDEKKENDDLIIDDYEEDIDDNDEDETDDNDNDSKTTKSKPSYNAKNDMKSFIIKVGGIVIGGIVALLLVLWIVSLFSQKNRSYEDIETIMTNAAKSYFAENPSSLPAAENQIVEIEAGTLAATGKMKELSEYTGTGVVCSGKVQVTKSGTDYAYTPFLNCGDSYSSKTLGSAITTDNVTTTTGYGLYSMNNELVFRGEQVNNYVQMEKSLWRIVKVDSSNNIVLIKDDKAGYGSAWDDRYNETLKYNVGMNNYSTSRIREKLIELYTTTDKGIIFLSDNDKTKLLKYAPCVGARKVKTEQNNGTVECATKGEEYYLGLLQLSDYINASTDSACKTSENRQCQNYNYLKTTYNWWTGTPVGSTDYESYSISEKGIIEVSKTSEYKSVRPVIKMSSNTRISSGNGSKETPYLVK